MSTGPVIRSFTERDIPPALALCRVSGWNQLPEDWIRFVDHQPDGCFAADIDGKLVGTVTTIRYETKLAWIGMMLVDPNYRRRGIATALMNRALQYLQSLQIKCIKLDATPEGQLVYQRLGFQAEWEFHRWEFLREVQDVHPDEASDFDADHFGRLDLEAFGAARQRWLQRMAAESICCVQANGFGMIRPGHLAAYLGPIIADDPHAALNIIESLVSQVSGTIFWDIPGPNKKAVELAMRLGFQPVRDLTRMWMGELLSPNIELQYAFCDPSTG